MLPFGADLLNLFTSTHATLSLRALSAVRLVLGRRHRRRRPSPPRRHTHGPHRAPAPGLRARRAYPVLVEPRGCVPRGGPAPLHRGAGAVPHPDVPGPLAGEVHDVLQTRSRDFIRAPRDVIRAPASQAVRYKALETDLQSQASQAKIQVNGTTRIALFFLMKNVLDIARPFASLLKILFREGVQRRFGQGETLLCQVIPFFHIFEKINTVTSVIKNVFSPNQTFHSSGGVFLLFCVVTFERTHLCATSIVVGATDEMCTLGPLHDGTCLPCLRDRALGARLLRPLDARFKGLIFSSSITCIRRPKPGTYVFQFGSGVQVGSTPLDLPWSLSPFVPSPVSLCLLHATHWVRVRCREKLTRKHWVLEVNNFGVCVFFCTGPQSMIKNSERHENWLSLQDEIFANGTPPPLTVCATPPTRGPSGAAF